MSQKYIIKAVANDGNIEKDKQKILWFGPLEESEKDNIVKKIKRICKKYGSNYPGILYFDIIPLEEISKIRKILKFIDHV